MTVFCLLKRLPAFLFNLNSWSADFWRCPCFVYDDEDPRRAEQVRGMLCGLQPINWKECQGSYLAKSNFFTTKIKSYFNYMFIVLWNQIYAAMKNLLFYLPFR